MRTSPSILGRSSRRSFLHKGVQLAALGTVVPPRAALAAATEALTRAPDDRSPEEIARDEDFWRPIQEAWNVDRSLLNLNNGGVSPPLRAGMESFERLADFSYQVPAYHMWRTLEPQKEAVRTSLARHFGADREEIAIVRNASEALEIAIFGQRLEAGDEVVSTDQDYPRMVQAWQQRARREGVVFRQIELPMGPEPAFERVVQAFESAITERTKVLHLCHVVNLTGQVLPVKEICARARRRGIVTIVDGAHSFAHLDFRAEDLGCDYFGTSLHKWYSAPIGTGMLYVRRERVRDTWPLFSADASLDDDIRKFEQIGTHSVPLFLAIAESCRFHDTLGFARKTARMRYLRERWAAPLAALPKVRLHTPPAPVESCGIANFQVEGMDSGELGQVLLRDHRIVVCPIHHERFDGIRVSPHLYTTLEELDRFREAVERTVRSGLPG